MKRIAPVARPSADAAFGLTVLASQRIIFGSTLSFLVFFTPLSEEIHEN
jgi:hypothetical protein